MTTSLGDPMDWLVMAITILALTGLALLAWSVKALDAIGAVTAWIVGFWVVMAGDLTWLVVMALFSVIGALVTFYGRHQKKERGLAEARDGERSWQNVLANGGAGALAALAFTALGDHPAAALAFVTATAAVTADTMASEVGCLAPSSRRITPPFPVEPPGTNGAVSLRGQVAAASGASIIAVVAALLGIIPMALAWVPALAGFIGCQLDSVLGATLEKDALRQRPLSKEDVNFLASAVPALVVLVLGALL